jgi:glyoxalase superfamily protein
MAVRIDLTLDCANATTLAAFWKLALGYQDEPPPAPFATRQEWLQAVAPGEDSGPDDGAWLRDPDGVGPRLSLLRVPEPKSAKNRLHIDLRVAGTGTAEERWTRITKEVDSPTRRPPARAGGRRVGLSISLLLRLVFLLVAEDALAALPDLVGRPVSLLVEATAGPLVNLFLTLGEGVVRLVAEPLHVHTGTSFPEVFRIPRTRQPQQRGDENSETSGRSLDLAVQDLVGDRLEGGANRARGDAFQGGPGRVDLGLGGVAGFGEGG